LFFGAGHHLVCFSYINIRQKFFLPVSKKRALINHLNKAWELFGKEECTRADTAKTKEFQVNDNNQLS
jgi:hypothetical protein